MQPKPAITLRRTGPTTAAVDYTGYKLPKIDSVQDQSPEDLNSASDGTQVGEIRPTIPSGWLKGQLLNVRNNGIDYVVTLFPEEFDPRYPERALKFSNPAKCQDFVSNWYQRENCDPRAF